MELLGYIMAIIIGISLGLIGGGGSILAVPMLAYLFAFDEKVATAYSLFIVGAGALVGGLRQHKNQNVDWKMAFTFGLPAIVGVWSIRHFLVPILPDVLFTIGGLELTRRMGMLGLFALLMLLAAYSMISSKAHKGVKTKAKFNLPLIATEGVAVGAITGLVGAGGGFLIIPALVVLADLEIKKAIGTSLIIIAMKSLTGFLLGDARSMPIDWQFLILISALVISGIFVGTYLSNFIDGKRLKKGFGYFILIMAVFIFIMEFFVITNLTT